MGAFFAILRNPVFILTLVFLGLLWYYYQKVMATYQAAQKAKKLSERKENRENNLWLEYEKWRNNQTLNLPQLSLDGINDLQVRERAQEALLKQLEASESEPAVKAWRLSLQDAKVGVLTERSKIMKCEEEWESLQASFPTNVLIGLLNLSL